jgi:hypothetical protein
MVERNHKAGQNPPRVVASQQQQQQQQQEPLGRPRHRWEDNINMDLQVVGRTAWTGFIWLRIGTGGRPL